MSTGTARSIPSHPTTTSARSRRRTAGLLATVVGLSAGVAAAAPSGGAAATEPCTASRPYGLTQILDGEVSTGVVGRGTRPVRDQASGRWLLVVTDRQAEYLAESVAGGCSPTIEFTTEGTTSALGHGRSSYVAKVIVRLNGTSLRPRILESEAYPMFGCETIVCQTSTDYATVIGRALTVGERLIVTSTAKAEANAGGDNASDQAQADWDLEWPLLRIPIP